MRHYLFKRLIKPGILESWSVIPSRTFSNMTSSRDISLDIEFQMIDSPQKLLDSVKKSHFNKVLTPNTIFEGIKMLQRFKRTDLHSEIMSYWSGDTAEFVSISPALIKHFAVVKDMKHAELIAQKLGIVLDGSGSIIAHVSQSNNDFTSAILTDLALGHIHSGNWSNSLTCLETMVKMELRMEDSEVPKKILKQFLSKSPSNECRSCLRLLLLVSNSLNDVQVTQMLQSAFLRSVNFVTGAVSMSTLPSPDCPEVAFIGRSNVGKSSLINMITNRNQLARTSKKPGKTAEFNFFEAIGSVGVSHEPHRFYLVDLPGVGYALKSRALRRNWTSLLEKYVRNRHTLRVLFHLVDSRHGLLATDLECLELLSGLPEHVQYVVVLTKVDKGHVREDVVDGLYLEIARRTSRVVPVLLTSSANKEGAASVLSVLLDGVNWQL